MASRTPGGEKHARISRGQFFLAVFFRVMHVGPSETGATRSLLIFLFSSFYSSCLTILVIYNALIIAMMVGWLIDWSID